MPSVPCRALILVWSITLASCGTTVTPNVAQFSEPYPNGVRTPPTVVSHSEVRPSRFSNVFDSIEISALHSDPGIQLPEGFIENLRAAIVHELRHQQLFAQVVPEAEPRERGGVLTLNGTVLSWKEQAHTATVSIRLALAYKGAAGELAHATTEGELRKVLSKPSYEVQPVVDGAVGFVTAFMRPNR